MRRSGIVLVGVLLSLALPAGAQAYLLGLPQPLLEQVPPQLRAKVMGQPVRPGSSSHPAFELKAKGYRVRVTGVGSSVAIEVEHGKRAPVTAYLARGVVAPHRLRASFGKYGSVAMRFEPAQRGPRKEDDQGSCRGRHGLQAQHGVFVGSFRFRGEDGYLSLQAHRAKGVVFRVAPRCASNGSSGRRSQSRTAQGGAGPRGNVEPRYLVASWRQGVSTASFSAVAFGSTTLYMANVEQTEGAVAKLHFAFAVAPTTTFALDHSLTFARVTPPSPFAGNGTYRAAPDGTRTWQGALALDFPGLPNYRLTGAPFKATLEAGF